MEFASTDLQHKIFLEIGLGHEKFQRTNSIIVHVFFKIHTNNLLSDYLLVCIFQNSY